MKANSNGNEEQIQIRPHVYDGIQEYDQRLPNWWLWTFYITIIVSVVYWMVLHQPGGAPLDEARIAAAMERVESARLSGALADLDNEALWSMSRNPEFTNPGQRTYQSLCAACHGPDLEGGIGSSLRDNEWKYGNDPMTVHRIIAQGSPDPTAGMQAWEGTLGARRVAEVAAYVLSYHDEASMAEHTVTHPDALP